MNIEYAEHTDGLRSTEVISLVFDQHAVEPGLQLSVSFVSLYERL